MFIESRPTLCVFTRITFFNINNLRIINMVINNLCSVKYSTRQQINTSDGWSKFEVSILIFIKIDTSGLLSK